MQEHALANQHATTMPPIVMENIIVLDQVTKRFPGVLALDNISFALKKGEAHAVCGENGAGKSTLMKVMSGLYQPDEGAIYYKQQQRRFKSSVEAEAAGIAIIHQELNLVPHLNVAENIFLAREPLKGWFVDKKRMLADATQLLARLNIDIDPAALVKSLSVAQQQMVEIAKALSLNAEVLIMDEPTSSLTESETRQLFDIINELKRDGVAIVYISHRLDELQHIIDRVTVMRDGKYVSTDNFADITIDDIVTKMVGRTLEEKFPERQSSPTDHVLMRVEGLRREGVFGPVSFALHRGEILGFAGLMGAGRTEVARALFGADVMTEGVVTIGDKTVSITSPIDAISHGLAYLSEDRKSQGLAISMTVATNMTLTNMDAVSNKYGFIQFDEEEKVAQKYIAAMGIKTPTSKQIVKNLSGGNQQKIVIGKWLFRESRIIIFDEPTRGIDVGAKFAIYQLIDKLASEGIGVILITSELPEILGMTDRVAVFHEGKIANILQTNNTSQEEIMHYASGRTMTKAHQETQA
jgi:ribose transport system ATP-binding protein